MRLAIILSFLLISYSALASDSNLEWKKFDWKLIFTKPLFYLKYRQFVHKEMDRLEFDIKNHPEKFDIVDEMRNQNEEK